MDTEGHPSAAVGGAPSRARRYDLIASSCMPLNVLNSTDPVARLFVDGVGAVQLKAQ